MRGRFRPWVFWGSGVKRVGVAVLAIAFVVFAPLAPAISISLPHGRRTSCRSRRHSRGGYGHIGPDSA